MRKPLFSRGFTLIELLVVMAIIAVLLTLAAPRYFEHLDRSREATLKQTLAVTRDAIDKFRGDRGAWPQSLQFWAAQPCLCARLTPLSPPNGGQLTSHGQCDVLRE